MTVFKKIMRASVALIMGAALAFSAAACDKEDGEHIHKFSSEWSNDSEYHWRNATCGDTDDVAGYGMHNTNGTDGACSVCGYNPKSGDNGDDDNDDNKGEHKHTFAEIWSRSTTRHWKAATCEHTDEKSELGNHDTNGTDGACSVCGYKAQSGGEDPIDPDIPAASVYSVVFESNGGSAVATQSVISGNKLVRPATPEYAGKQFVNWYEDSACTKVYDFSAPVTGNLHLYAKWVNLDAKILGYGGYNESLHVEWADGAPSQSEVYYKLVSASNWTKLEDNSPLIRATEDGVARADIVGIAAGEYNVKIKSSGSDTEISLGAPVVVTEYDRSGYAHFNHTEGVGAYDDDGELKNGALVIYVTDGNKNNVLDYAYSNGRKVDISQYMKGSDGTQYSGIGELLNNRRYNGNDRANVGISKLCDVYGAVAIRIIGKVEADANIAKGHENDADYGLSTITGLTDYNSTGNGGSVGDNGRMARMCNAKNLTIEGIGEDASIFGWGLHFIASEINYKSGMGKNFEVRNITFENYPEDAVGMEGEQKSKSASSELTFPVEHCWVHNNVFLPGYCSNPAESDKKEGDGSCDFKRGRYFTLAYNYFTDCHKTNLIGSASTSVQHCVTMHHNWWNNCGSRIPLVRAANVHFYNNYVYGDMSQSPKPALSYVHSVRANAYIFSEANYYDGCKEISGSSEGGGAVKAYNNQYHSCFNGDISTVVANRDDRVSNSCKYIFGNVDYSTFDTNPAVFYYNKSTNTSDCQLDDAVTARIKVMQYAGVNGFGTSDTTMCKIMPESAVKVNENGATNIELKTGLSTVNGVVFSSAAKLSSGVLKFKGQGIYFTLASEAQLTVTTTSAGDDAPDLLRADGAVIAGKFNSTLTIVLEAGTYFITSGQKDKESTVTALSFADTAASSAARIEAVKAAISAIPSDILLNDECAEKLNAAQIAYGALTSAEKLAFRADNAALYEKYSAAVANYSGLQVENVKDLISAIGTVTKNSFEKISAAQSAYDKLDAAQKQAVTNYQTLVKALEDYSAFAVQNVIEMIDALTPVASVSVSDRAAVEAAVAAYEKAQAAFENLETGYDEGEVNQQAQVTNISKLTEGLSALAQLEKLFDFKDALAEFTGTSVTSANLSEASALSALYKSLTPAQIAVLSSDESAKYTAIANSLETLLSQTQDCTFNGSISNSAFTAEKTDGKTISYKGSAMTVNATGEQYAKGLKFESKTVLSVTVSTKMTLTLYLNTANSLTLDGVTECKAVSVNGDYVITVELEAGTHTFARTKSETSLYYAMLTPAA